MPRRHYRRRSRRRSSDTEGLAVLAVLIGGALWASHRAWLDYTLYIAILVVAVTLLAVAYKLYATTNLRKRLATLEEVDTMGGVAFEYYVAELLRKHGFTHVKVTETFDMGVDIIAEKNGQRWGVQTKRYTGLVKAAAVRQVVGGLNSYHCNKSMVITNSTFSKYAIKLAHSNHCVLVDRVELAKLIDDVAD